MHPCHVIFEVIGVDYKWYDIMVRWVIQCNSIYGMVWLDEAQTKADQRI